jgi:hypothetical protein
LFRHIAHFAINELGQLDDVFRVYTAEVINLVVNFHPYGRRSRCRLCSQAGLLQKKLLLD